MSGRRDTPHGRQLMRRFAWLLLALPFLAPVLVTMHRAPARSGTGAAPVVEGLAAVDSLLDSIEGPVALNFWATWCSPCIVELPGLDRASAESGVPVVAIDIGDPDPEAFRRHASTSGLSITLAWVDGDGAAVLTERYGLPRLLPVTILLDSSRTETARFAGARDESFLRAALSGAVPVADSAGGQGLHVNVVGARTDPLALALEAEAVRLAGIGAVDFYDPSVPEDSATMAELFLPAGGAPYAQPCLGGACGRPVGDPGDLEEAVIQLGGT
jgi:thiol-disulfide isomerase/thioredoxin